MITTFFLINAIIMSPFFIKKDHTFGDKVIYFILSVILTPLIGPFIYKMLKGSATTNNNCGQCIGGDACI